MKQLTKVDSTPNELLRGNGGLGSNQSIPRHVRIAADKPEGPVDQVKPYGQQPQTSFTIVAVSENITCGQVNPEKRTSLNGGDTVDELDDIVTAKTFTKVSEFELPNSMIPVVGSWVSII